MVPGRAATFPDPGGHEHRKATHGDLVEPAGGLGGDAALAQDRDERGQRRAGRLDPDGGGQSRARNSRMVSQLTASIVPSCQARSGARARVRARAGRSNPSAFLPATSGSGGSGFRGRFSGWRARQAGHGGGSCCVPSPARRAGAADPPGEGRRDEGMNSSSRVPGPMRMATGRVVGLPSRAACGTTAGNTTARAGRGSCGLVHHAPLVAGQVLGGGPVDVVAAVLHELQRQGVVGAVD